MRHLPTLILLVATLACGPGRDTAPPPYRNARLPTRERVRDLLSRMTLEEKFWQLYMIPGDLDDPALDYSRGIFGLQISETPRGQGNGEAGRRRPPPDIARRHAERINAIQRYFVEKTRLGIPIIPFEEALHGLAKGGATAFPQAIGLAATWDPSLMARVAAASANETRSRGIRQALSPVVNIASDVRWGRVEETYGEDPYLSSVMGDGVRPGVRARRRRRDAEALRRQRRRRRARQLSRSTSASARWPSASSRRSRRPCGRRVRGRS